MDICARAHTLSLSLSLSLSLPLSLPLLMPLKSCWAPERSMERRMIGMK